MIDLRSDTVTQPTRAMREAMSAAPVGDDVFGEDPTVRELEEEVAALFGHESALFAPSGTMTNQMAIKAHTLPGDEMICEESCHIYTWECGGPAILSGVTSRTIPGNRGVISQTQLTDKIRPSNDHFVRTRIVSIENTHNRASGKVYPLKEMALIRKWTIENNLVFHCDGARIWNAIVASGHSAQSYGKYLDSISVCFSKGLGAPVGSAIIGSRDFIKKCKRIRKLFGGGMRQAGILAAGALFAVRNHIDRLAEDHQNAVYLAKEFSELPEFELEEPNPETNLVWFRLNKTQFSASEFVSTLRDKGVLIHQSGPINLRACTHLDVSSTMIKKACKIIKDTVAHLSK
ncbi:MAG: low-specificity L-threonine aldolase [Planctomycetota bacterium]